MGSPALSGDFFCLPEMKRICLPRGAVQRQAQESSSSFPSLSCLRRSLSRSFPKKSFLGCPLSNIALSLAFATSV